MLLGFIAAAKADLPSPLVRTQGRWKLKRRALILSVVPVVVLLGLIQSASMALYGDLARWPAVPALLPPALGEKLARPLRARWAPPALRAAYAQALLHRGNAGAASAIVATLPDLPAVADLRGQLAELVPDSPAALAAYVRAGDFERAQRLIDIRVAAGDNVAAAGLERELVDALSGTGRAPVRARALWRLGQITQVRSTADPERRTALARESLGYYEQALTIAPNEETYLLAAGQQALTLGYKSAATRYYQRALEAVPDSADARAGLVRART